MKHKKLRTIGELEQIAKQHKESGKKVVTTNGCFDILHVGHVRNLQMAKEKGDVLIVGINTDASVRANKGSKRPVIHEKERAELIASLSVVDYVFIFGSKTPIPWLKKIQPHVHVKGSDRNIEDVPERFVVEKNGGTVVLVPHTGKHSTTRIIKKILSL